MPRDPKIRSRLRILFLLVALASIAAVLALTAGGYVVPGASDAGTFAAAAALVVGALAVLAFAASD